jgi:hypothetical protein
MDKEQHPLGFAFKDRCGGSSPLAIVATEISPAEMQGVPVQLPLNRFHLWDHRFPDQAAASGLPRVEHSGSCGTLPLTDRAARRRPVKSLVSVAGN